MNKVEILAFSAAFGILAIRLYQKYIKKDSGKSGSPTNMSSGSKFISSSKDDDYEPYSKK
jgi:hypothetical protein